MSIFRKTLLVKEREVDHSLLKKSNPPSSCSGSINIECCHFDDPVAKHLFELNGWANIAGGASYEKVIIGKVSEDSSASLSEFVEI